LNGKIFTEALKSCRGDLIQHSPSILTRWPWTFWDSLERRKPNNGENDGPEPVWPGTDVLIFKNIFAEKFSEKMAFLTQNNAKLCKILIITLGFEKNANFFAENCRKLQKIVIITSTPDRANFCPLGDCLRYVTSF
jgi:hypothetical protein